MPSIPDFVVAIPARYAASRLPGKPLRLLGGEPLVLHVARRALAAGAREVWVATDDARIADVLTAADVRIAMTSPDHLSGTEGFMNTKVSGSQLSKALADRFGDATGLNQLRHVRMHAAQDAKPSWKTQGIPCQNLRTC